MDYLPCLGAGLLQLPFHVLTVAIHVRLLHAYTMFICRYRRFSRLRLVGSYIRNYSPNFYLNKSGTFS